MRFPQENIFFKQNVRMPEQPNVQFEYHNRDR